MQRVRWVGICLVVGSAWGTNAIAQNVHKLEGPPSTEPGSSFEVEDRVCNDTGNSTPPTQLEYYLSTDATIDASDTLIGSRSLPPLSPEQCKSGTSPVFANVPSGAYFLGAIV